MRKFRDFNEIRYLDNLDPEKTPATFYLGK